MVSVNSMTFQEEWSPCVKHTKKTKYWAYSQRMWETLQLAAHIYVQDTQLSSFFEFF